MTLMLTMFCDLHIDNVLFYSPQANREQLDEYLEMLQTARSDDKHADAVIWKFCDLDVDPVDRYIVLGFSTSRL